MFSAVVRVLNSIIMGKPVSTPLQGIIFNFLGVWLCADISTFPLGPTYISSVLFISLFRHQLHVYLIRHLSNDLPKIFTSTWLFFLALWIVKGFKFLGPIHTCWAEQRNASICCATAHVISIGLFVLIDPASTALFRLENYGDVMHKNMMPSTHNMLGSKPQHLTCYH